MSIDLAKLEVPEDAIGDTDQMAPTFGPLESDIYLCTIERAFLKESQGGAIAVEVYLKTENGKEVRQTTYITNREKKPFKVYDDGTKKYLPGFNLMNSMSRLTTGKNINELKSTPKVVKLYNFEAKKEVDTEVPMLMDLVGKKVIAGIQKQLVNKREQQDGQWVDLPQFREVNEVDKFFHPQTGMTATETKDGAEEPQTLEKWKARWRGEVRDRRTIKDGDASQNGIISSGAPTAPLQESAEPAPDLFA